MRCRPKKLMKETNGERGIYNHREPSAKSVASLYRDTSSISVAETIISLLNPVRISGMPKASHASLLLEATRARIFCAAPVMNYSAMIKTTKVAQQHTTHHILVFQPIPELLPILFMLLIFARHKLDPSARSARLQCAQKCVTSLNVIEFPWCGRWRHREYLLEVESRNGPRTTSRFHILENDRDVNGGVQSEGIRIAIEVPAMKGEAKNLRIMGMKR